MDQDPNVMYLLIIIFHSSFFFLYSPLFLFFPYFLLYLSSISFINK